MSQLQKQLNEIKNKLFKPVYLVLGNEQYLIEKTKQAFGDSVLDEDEASMNFGQFNMKETPVDLAVQEAESFPFFGDRRLVFIQDPYFLTGEKVKTDVEHDLNQFMQYVENPSDFSVMVIFAPYEKLDKRKKITKLLTKHAEVLDVNPMNERELPAYIANYVSSKGFSFEPRAMDVLIERTNHQLTAIMSELDKLFLFHSDDRTITIETINLLVARSLESNIFNINKYVLSGNVHVAIQSYNDLLKQKQDPIKIIAIMMGQFRLLIQAKILRTQGYQAQEITRSLKIHPYRVKLALQQEKQFSKELLSTAYRQLIDTDYMIKSGQVESKLQFELFVMNFNDSRRRVHS